MDNELLRIVYPDRFLVCGECAVALALAARISTLAAREVASQNNMEPNPWLQIHCNDYVDSLKLVPDPDSQTAIQVQVRDSSSIVSMTDPGVVICPGKARQFSSQQHQLLGR